MENFKDNVINTEPKQILDFITSEERNTLLDIFYSNEEKWHLRDGLKDSQSRLNCPQDIPYIQDHIIPKILSIIGEAKCIGDNIYKTHGPYVIHTDANNDIEGLIPYKNVVLPLKVDKDLKTKIFLFNQRYYDKAAHFLNGSNKIITTVYNEIITDSYYNYDKMEFLEDNKISEQWWEENININYIPYSNFEGLSLQCELPWEINSLIVFDSWQPHCSQNFVMNGSLYKIGLSLVFMKEENE